MNHETVIMPSLIVAFLNYWGLTELNMSLLRSVQDEFQYGTVFILQTMSLYISHFAANTFSG